MGQYDPKRRAEKQQMLLDNPGLAPHGSPSTYSNWGCRCDDCKAAWAEACHRRRQKRAQLAKAGKIKIPHGDNGYTNYACRCTICTSTHTRYNKYRSLSR